MFVRSPSFVIVSAVSQSYCCPHLRRHHQRHHGSRHNLPPRPPPRLVVSREFSQNTRYYGILVSLPGLVLSSPAASRSCFFPRWSLLLSLSFLHCHHQHHGQPLCSPSFASLCPCRLLWFTSLLVISGIHQTSRWLTLVWTCLDEHFSTFATPQATIWEVSMTNKSYWEMWWTEPTMPWFSQWLAAWMMPSIAWTEPIGQHFLRSVDLVTCWVLSFQEIAVRIIYPPWN